MVKFGSYFLIHEEFKEEQLMIQIFTLGTVKMVYFFWIHRVVKFLSFFFFGSIYLMDCCGEHLFYSTIHFDFHLIYRACHFLDRIDWNWMEGAKKLVTKEYSSSPTGGRERCHAYNKILFYPFHIKSFIPFFFVIF